MGVRECEWEDPRNRGPMSTWSGRLYGWGGGLGGLGRSLSRIPFADLRASLPVEGFNRPVLTQRDGMVMETRQWRGAPGLLPSTDSR
jgi:hypothetical protein